MNRQLVLLYDDHCPLCSWYSGGFVHLGLLPPGGRLPLSRYQSDPTATGLDMQRASHEIPLLDVDAHTIYYGLDALLVIIGQRYTLAARLTRLPIIYQLLKVLYAFISYNRRVIAGSNSCAGQCSPDFHLAWRLSWILLCVSVASLITILAGYWAGVALTGTPIAAMVSLAAIGGGWVVYLLSLSYLPWRCYVDFAGQVSTIMLVGVLLLLPACFIAQLGQNSTWLWAASVMLSFGMMNRMHWLRLHVSQLPYQLHWRWLALLTLTASTLFLLFL